ncbi:MAG: alginate lyase family protein [Deltaproteobacteria bacterium]|nr:alginate lyase family protein [Deltaproteobacteria bacterium]
MWISRLFILPLLAAAALSVTAIGCGSDEDGSGGSAGSGGSSSSSGTGGSSSSTSSSGTGGDGGAGAASALPAAGLFLTVDDLARAIERSQSDAEPFATGYSHQSGRADNALSETADPFHMTDVLDITFGWCSDGTPNVDDTLKEATEDYSHDGNLMRVLALQYALTGESSYGDKAVELMTAWAADFTEINLYDFAIDFDTATITGMTDGYCSDRPWNFALDAMWQTYGLINTADAYLLLSRNGYVFDSADEQAIRDLILRVTEAVNSSFHAWTRWADAHPSSSSFERYRADNHLSWCLAGLLAGAAALQDDALAAYVLTGGSWTDSQAGPYENPSHVRDVIDRAIESGTGEDNEGRVYEELILRDPPIGYSFFHLWALGLTARIAEVHYGDDVWSFVGTDGGGLELAYERYVAFMLGERQSPEPQQEGDLTASSWQYELVYRRWPTDRFQEAIEVTSRNAFILQSIGPVTFLLGEELPN